MGNILDCFCKKNHNKQIFPIEDEELDKDEIKVNEKLKNEFYCPICVGNIFEIPDILKIHSESGKIEFRCRKRGKNKVVPLKKYLGEIPDNKCFNSNKCSKKSEYYCFDCHHSLCGECRLDDINSDITLTEESSIICGDSVCIKCGTKNITQKHRLFHLSEVTSKCNCHGEDTDLYCLECDKNICKKCSYTNHKSHIIKNKINEEAILKAKNTIFQKDLTLLKMKEFYNMVLELYKSDPNNPIYKQNLINVAKSIKKEDSRNKFDKELAIYRLQQMKANIGIKY